MKRTFSYLFLSIIFSCSTTVTAQTKADLKWTNSVGEIIKPLQVEVDTSNADVGGVFVYVTYEMLKSCKNFALFSRSMSKDGVVLNEASSVHSNVVPGSKFRDNFLATYQKGHSVVLYKAYCTQS